MQARRGLELAVPMGINLAIFPKQFAAQRAVGAANDGHPIERPPFQVTTRLGPQIFARHDLGAVDRVESFQLAGQVDGIAGYRVLEPVGRADVSDDRPAGVQADTHVKRFAAQTCPVTAEDAESRLAIQGGPAGG